MKMQSGKTTVKCTSDNYQCMIKVGDIGYIDGYVQAADGRPYAIFVRVSDGVIDMVMTHCLLAIEST